MGDASEVERLRAERDEAISDARRLSSVVDAAGEAIGLCLIAWMTHGVGVGFRDLLSVATVLGFDPGETTAEVIDAARAENAAAGHRVEDVAARALGSGTAVPRDREWDEPEPGDWQVRVDASRMPAEHSDALFDLIAGAWHGWARARDGRDPSCSATGDQMILEAFAVPRDLAPPLAASAVSPPAAPEVRSGTGLMQSDPDQPVPSPPDTGESRSRAGTSDREVPGGSAGRPTPATPGAPPAEASSYAGESPSPNPTAVSPPAVSASAPEATEATDEQ